MQILKTADKNGRELVRITRISPFSGQANVMDMRLRVKDYLDYTRGAKLIQNAFPYLTADEREFIKTGITPLEWDTMFLNDTLEA